PSRASRSRPAMRFADGTEPPPMRPPLVLPAQPYAHVMRDVIADALERHQSVRAAAEALGMPKSTLADKVHKLGIPIPTRRAGRR
ncbi:MAG: hypothetical protein K8M05_18245, partial [Deltaproteobacteria bacterium]|nr:hypothetical protein [Kofleriaceae bacterium]